MRDFISSNYMKIALACPASLPATQFGGILFLSIHIAKRLSDEGHEMTIYTSDLDFANNASTFNKKLPKKEKIGKYTIKRTHVWFSTFLFFVNPGMYKQMMNDDFDLIHTIGVRSFQSFVATLVSKRKKIPCFDVMGDLILNFSKIINQKASREPSAQHVLDEEYYDRIEAIQFTMNHDDGNQTDDIEKSDIILLGVSRTSKTPTSIYLANRGYKTSNIPLVNENSIPNKLKSKNLKSCIIGLTTEPERLYDIRKNRLNSLREKENVEYVDIDKIKKEVEDSKKIFQKNQWPTIDITRKSVEETAASVIKIYEIKNKKNV